MMACEVCGKPVNGNTHPAVLLVDHAVHGCAEPVRIRRPR